MFSFKKQGESLVSHEALKEQFIQNLNVFIVFSHLWREIHLKFRNLPTKQRFSILLNNWSRWGLVSKCKKAIKMVQCSSSCLQKPWDPKFIWKDAMSTPPLCLSQHMIDADWFFTFGCPAPLKEIFLEHLKPILHTTNTENSCLSHQAGWYSKITSTW